MDIPRPDNFNETYLYEGTLAPQKTDPLRFKFDRMLTRTVSPVQS